MSTTRFSLSPSIYGACQAHGVPVVQTLHNFRLLCPGVTFFRDGKSVKNASTAASGAAFTMVATWADFSFAWRMLYVFICITSKAVRT